MYKAMRHLYSKVGIALLCCLAAIGAILYHHWEPCCGYRLSERRIGELTSVAEKGDANASRLLRLHYEHEENKAMALYWIKRGAAQGDNSAKYDLYTYTRRLGTREAEQEAIGLLRSAADRGYSLAQIELGKLYKNGELVDKNFELVFNCVN